MENRLKPQLHSFLFRLVLYFALVGIIPCSAAMYLFYYETTAHAEQEFVDEIKHAHDSTMQRLRRTLEVMHTAADAVGADPSVQRYLTLQSEPDISDEAAGLRETIFDRLQEQTNRIRYVTQACLQTENAGRTICLQADTGIAPLEWFGSTEDSTFRSTEVLVDGQAKYGLRYISAMIGSTADGGRGRLVLKIDLSSLMDEIEDNGLILGQVLADSNGKVIYREGAQTEVKPWRDMDSKPGSDVQVTAKTITAQQRMEMEGQIWQSQWVVGNRFQAAALHFFRNAAFLFIGLLVLLSWIGVIIFSRYITRPLNHLQRLMKRAERGDLKAYWVSNSAHEINELGQSYNQMLNRLEDLIKQVKREESLKKEAEIEALQYQLNPHFLYNTLNTIKWVAKLHKTPQISEVISALVRLLQASLGKKGDFITLREEVGLIRDYMEIQHFRYGDRVQVNFEIDSVASLCLVPRMILQPLVENACIHGIEPSKREGLITIKAWIDRDLLFCEVEDNGIGMKINPATGEPDSKTDGLQERMSGIGLRHIREKIKLYYGDDYKMRIISKEMQGTTIRLSMPVHQSEV